MAWARRREAWPDLAAVYDRHGYAGGFVLGDPFEVQLREIGTRYLANAWARAAPVLARHGLTPPAVPDLTWGSMHAGVSVVAPSGPGDPQVTNVGASA